MTKVEFNRRFPFLSRYYKLNHRRFYREAKAVNLVKSMRDEVFPEMTSSMFFYYTKDYCVSPFKPEDK